MAAKAFRDVWCTVAAPKLFLALTAAGFAAGAATLADGNTLALSARGRTAAVPAATFAERFAIGSADVDCSKRSWPYLGAECLRMSDGSRVSTVRIIAINRAMSRARSPGLR